jgi:hypothetical protein
LLQKHLTCGTELILIGWKIVPNEEHVQCDHRFASQPLANEPLHSSQLRDVIAVVMLDGTLVVFSYRFCARNFILREVSKIYCI